jgi:hypothetical protein
LARGIASSRSEFVSSKSKAGGRRLLVSRKNRVRTRKNRVRRYIDDLFRIWRGKRFIIFEVVKGRRLLQIYFIGKVKTSRNRTERRRRRSQWASFICAEEERNRRDVDGDGERRKTWKVWRASIVRTRVNSTLEVSLEPGVRMCFFFLWAAVFDCNSAHYGSDRFCFGSLNSPKGHR